MPAPHHSPVPGPGELTPSVQVLLEQAVAAGVAPAISCALALGGRQLPVLCGGAAQTSTFFDLASVTKLFTTVTALALVDSGTLELDTPISAHLDPYRSAAKSAVTLRHLLTHTSGLPSEWQGWHAALSQGRGFDREALLADLLSTELESAPGTRFEYSCAGFNTIMALAEQVTGTAWASLVQQHVLDKLPTSGITGSPPLDQCAPTEFQPRLGRGLVQGVVHDESAWSLGGLSGNAGMFATAAGLRVFGTALLNGLPGILSLALAAQMWRSQLPEMLGSHFSPDNPGFGHGLGVRINQQPWMGPLGTHARGHGGFTGTSLLVDKSLGAVIVLLSNRVSPCRDGNDATPLRTAVSDVVLAEAGTVTAEQQRKAP
ncbi:serine hydrolase [Arthrobacter sp.]|uniref:serine hydrolase domain-containing protein n=1 Tax=Arthrobacter sp. TaxID=1667 RepID=UPI0026DF1099|nr:serine hydrolase domain-containing protein [Arthrobacter sp.]MDO5751960.1 serine hydrolase domain-containing protein [Arthrobacter sp.]